MSPLLNMVLCPIGGLTPSTSYRGRIVSKKIPLRETSHKLKQYPLKKKGKVIFTKHKTRSIQTATTAPPAGKGWSLMLFKKLIVTFKLFIYYSWLWNGLFFSSHGDKSTNEWHVWTAAVNGALCWCQLYVRAKGHWSPNCPAFIWLGLPPPECSNRATTTTTWTGREKGGQCETLSVTNKQQSLEVLMACLELVQWMWIKDKPSRSAFTITQRETSGWVGGSVGVLAVVVVVGQCGRLKRLFIKY